MRNIVILLSIAATLLFSVAAAEDYTPVESECVTFVTCPRGLGTSHCTPINFQFEAVNSHSKKPNHGIRYSLASGPGVIDEQTGLWTFDPTTMDVLRLGQRFKCAVVATQGHGKNGDTCQFSVRVYNNAPRPFYIGPYHKDSIPVIAGKHNMIPVWWLDRDSCDLIQKSFSFSSTAPGGSIFIDDDPNASTFPDVGNLIFFPNSADAGKSFVIHLTAFDGIDSSSLDLQLYVEPQVVAPSEYAVAIKKYPAVIQGQFVNVDVELQKSTMDLQSGGLGGFDLLIGYDASALSLQNVHYDSMSIFQLCDWEYFTYRPGVPANCTTGCPSGMVRVVGLAETNNGAHHPTCPPLNLPPNLPVTLFKMQFLVSNDPTFESLYIPIRFFWMDCGDNSIANWDGSQLHLARRVFDYWDYQTPLDSMYAVFPGYGGVPSDSCHPTDPWKPEPGRTIDFYNGSLFIISPDTIDPRGDINLNGISYETSDCVMFSNYFIYGLAAFQGHIAGSTAESDVNADGLPLTLADLVYLQHIIAGDANPVPPAPSTDTARLLFADQTLLLETPDTLGALRLVFEGEIVPELLAHQASISYTSGTPNTTVLISGVCESGAASLATGQLLNVTAGHRLISAEAATYEGGMIPVVVDLTQPQSLRGDINANGVPFEIADYTVYRDYFMHDTTEFSGHVQESIDNSDINRDGATLTVADLLYLWRVIHGDSLPYPESVNAGIVATFYHPGGTIGQLAAEFPDSLGAVYFLLEGNGSVDCHWYEQCQAFYDGTNTHVLLAPSVSGQSIPAIVQGWIIGYGWMWDVYPILHVEAATYDGAVMPTELGDWLDAPEDRIGALPKSFALLQNYPNPFNAGTVISFDLPHASDVRLEVINIAGQVVHAVNRRFNAGSHTIAWDGSANGRAVASGIYYYRLTAGDFVATKKMVLLK